MNQIAGRPGTACITGAGSGIGRSYAVALSRAGFRLIVTGRHREPLEELARELPEVEVVAGDLRTSADCDTLGQLLAEREDLTLLIHNAGYGLQQSYLQSPVEQIREMGELHMQCPAALIRYAYPRLARQAASVQSRIRPAIILVSSLAAFLPAPGPASYTATKAFQISLGRALHPQAVADGVQLQLLCPGFTHTRFHDRLGWSAEERKDRGIVRWMTSEEVVRRSLHRLWNVPVSANPVYIPGAANRLIAAMVRMMPPALYRRIARSLDR